jgi:glycosyltransferase involved in cell wall biosynthesis
MATGKPVIATRHGGPLEMVQEGETGYLVAPDDPDELAARLLYLLEWPDMAAAVGQRARALCEARFTVERSCAEIMGWYEATCEPTSDGANG